MITFRHEGPDDQAQCTVCGAWVRAEDLPHHADLLAETLDYLDMLQVAAEVLFAMDPVPALAKDRRLAPCAICHGFRRMGETHLCPEAFRRAEAERIFE